MDERYSCMLLISLCPELHGTCFYYHPFVMCHETKPSNILKITSWSCLYDLSPPRQHNVTHDMFTYTSSTCHVNKSCQRSYVVMSLVDVHITTRVLFTWLVPSSWNVGCCSMFICSDRGCLDSSLWAQYVFLGALQCTTQIVSYEISIGHVLILY